jgi:hypothetical protein
MGQTPSQGSVEKTGLRSGGTVMVNGQMTEVVTSHCFQGFAFFCEE